MDKQTFASILKREPYIDLPKIVRPEKIISEAIKHSNIKDPKELAAITDRIQHAVAMASAAHEGVVRKSGEPYIFHPYSVAYMLAASGMDDDCIIAGILHDTVEDTSITSEDIAENFGKDVATLVDGVTKLTEIRVSETSDVTRKLSREEKQAAAIKKLLTFAQNDSRIIIVKLFDRLHNMMTLDAMAPEKQLRIAEETLNLYVPLAHRLGIYWLKEELEALAFYFGFRKKWEEIDKTVVSIYPNLMNTTGFFDKKVKEIVTATSPELAKKISKVYCKTKSYYHIYAKTLKKNLEVGNVKNMLSVRIVLKTDNVFDCYAVLASIHSFPEFVVVQRYLRDYIATPKVNGYQSIHTLIRHKEYFVEIQICTEEMEKVAQEGLLPTWNSKNNPLYRDKIADWLKEIFANELVDVSPETFVEEIETVLPLEKITVFTPTGDEISLPEGSTLLDFAYAIHSGIGDSCIGGTINGRRVTISHVLQSKDEVKAETSENQNPRADWLNFVKTQRAKQFIKRYLQKQLGKIMENKGRETLKALFVSQDRGEYFDNLEKQPEFKALAQRFSLPKQGTLTTFFIKAADGGISMRKIIEAFFSPEEVERLVVAFPSKIAPLFNAKPKGEEIQLPPIFIKDIGEISDYSVAHCCQPDKGDFVVAAVTPLGYVLHKKNCTEAAKIDSMHLKNDVYWFDYDKYEISFIVRLKNKKGAMLELAKELSDNDFNISSLHLNSDDAEEVTGNVYVTVKGSNIQSVEALEKSLKNKEVIIDFKISNIDYRG